MKLSNIVSLLLSFDYDLDYLEIYFESTGGEIIFNNNIIKNITNIKENLPYYFSTKTNLFQTSLITLRIKSNKNMKLLIWISVNLIIKMLLKLE